MLESFILNNIKNINNNIDFVKKSGYNKTEVRAYLKEKFDSEIEVDKGLIISMKVIKAKL